MQLTIITIKLQYVIRNTLNEKCEDTNWVIRSRYLKNDRQYNG